MTEELMNHYVWVIAVLGSRGFNDSPGLEEKRNMSNTYLKSLSITTIQVSLESALWIINF